MALIKIDDVKRGQPDIYLVRRAQTRIALDQEYPNLMQFYHRPAFQSVAVSMTERYWPGSVASKRSVVDLVTELYTLWLIMLPISFRHLGYWRPGWGTSIFMSWFRSHIHNYKRFYLGRKKFIWENAILKDGFADAQISDQDFIDIASQYLQQHRGETARAVFARMIFAPFVFWQQARESVQIAQEHNCGLMWYEDEALFLTRKPWDAPDVEWSDLRANPQDILFWRVGVKEELLNVVVRPSREKSLRDEIKDILASDTKPAYKLSGVNACLKRYYNWAKYIPTTRMQAISMEKWVWKKISKTIMPINPGLKEKYYNLKHQKWDTSFRQGRRSMLLDKDVTEAQWAKIWLPRRG